MIECQRPDVYYVLADFDSYCKALINIANSGKFSSDRTIEDYVRDIWKLDKLQIN